MAVYFTVELCGTGNAEDAYKGAQELLFLRRVFRSREEFMTDLYNSIELLIARLVVLLYTKLPEALEVSNDG